MATCVSLIVLLDTRDVSTSDQNTSMQLRAFERAGVLEVHEEQMSQLSRGPYWISCFAGLKRGDTRLWSKLDRLARSMTQFLFESLRISGFAA